ncbi:MAG: hypothetical protein KGL39_24855 [Patescibacteria group bacterium]|nr:hypothetical protein [Patescibacteria group bacterium]
MIDLLCVAGVLALLAVGGIIRKLRMTALHIIGLTVVAILVALYVDDYFDKRTPRLKP